MRAGIHPNYKKVKVICTSCGNEFETGSVLDEIRVDTCSNCHPFYTGKQRFASADGRVEKFNKKDGLRRQDARTCLYRFFFCIKKMSIHCIDIYL